MEPEVCKNVDRGDSPVIDTLGIGPRSRLHKHSHTTYTGIMVTLIFSIYYSSDAGPLSPPPFGACPIWVMPPERSTVRCIQELSLIHSVLHSRHRPV